jgi:putative two-component system response regulator
MDEGKDTLLIVEDNVTLREGLKEMLSFEGFSVATAGHGREALALMNTFSPSLILSDISMPLMDGYAFFKRVRERPEWITIPFIFLTARGEREDIMTGRELGAEDYLVKPVSREELLTAVRSRLDRSRQLKLAQLEQAYELSLIVLASAIEVEHEYTGEHVKRVRDYSMVLANLMGLPEKRRDSLRFGAILHDIGKRDWQKSLLNKVEPLDEGEWQLIRQHPVTGAEILKRVPYLAPAAPIVRHHHERWDGNGYPDGLQGENIPLEARILSVADGFDAMTTDRSYHPARSPDAAYQEIVACAGVHFDPTVVEAFEKAWSLHLIQDIAEASLSHH